MPRPYAINLTKLGLFVNSFKKKVIFKKKNSGKPKPARVKQQPAIEIQQHTDAYNLHFLSVCVKLF